MDKGAKSDPLYEKYQNVLEGVEIGKVVTRFPPEPSGFLHVGHAKAAMINFHYANIYEGKMILRFDDTNPSKEKVEFVDNIIQDLKTLDIYPAKITYTSDYFGKIQEVMEQFIQKGLCYADDTPAEEMKAQRLMKVESKHRNNSVEENLKHWNEILSATEEGQKWCIRGRLNMQSEVGCMRDPVFYRVNLTPHHKTGTQFKAYPTYDFACPIVDSIEGVTHAMRSIEYHDRNEMFHWVIKEAGLRDLIIYDYSRLSLVSTVLSKRKLQWFVENKVVEGWNDPRFPTVQGIMRRGMTVEAIKEFMLEQGPSKNTNHMEWDKLWATNKKIIDPIAPRYSAVVVENACHIHLSNVEPKFYEQAQPLHPKNPDVGNKDQGYFNDIIIELEDAKLFKEGETITLLRWGNAKISKIEHDKDGKPVIHADLNLEDKDFKKTKKVNWLPFKEDWLLKVSLVEFDHLITKSKIEKHDDVTQIINPHSKFEYIAYAEGNMRKLPVKSIIQFERRGFFYLDSIEGPNGQHFTFHFIPDGKTKSMSILTSKVDAKQMAKGKEEDKKVEKKQDNKKAENAKGQEGKEEEKKGPSKKDLKKLEKKEGKKTQGGEKTAEEKEEHRKFIEEQKKKAEERKKQKLEEDAKKKEANIDSIDAKQPAPEKN